MRGERARGYPDREDEVDASIGVGLMVGVNIISMYLPMFKMLSLVK